MKLKPVCIMAVLACILVLAAGCTSTPGTNPGVTTTAPTTAITAAPTTAAPAMSVTGAGNATTTNDTITRTTPGTPPISQVNGPQRYPLPKTTRASSSEAPYKNEGM